jgi:hypothetical protein
MGMMDAPYDDFLTVIIQLNIIIYHWMQKIKNEKSNLKAINKKSNLVFAPYSYSMVSPNSYFTFEVWF